MTSNSSLTFNVILFGNKGSGKTGIYQNYFDNTFNEDTESTGMNKCRTKNLNINGQDILLKVFDSVGGERFHEMTIKYYKNNNSLTFDGIVFVFSVLDRKSLYDFKFWLESELKEEIKPEETILCLFGTKCDLKDQSKITEGEVKEFAQKLNIKTIFYTSARTGEGIEHAFDELVKNIMKKKGLYSEKREIYEKRKENDTIITKENIKKKNDLIDLRNRLKKKKEENILEKAVIIYSDSNEMAKMEKMEKMENKKKPYCVAY